MSNSFLGGVGGALDGLCSEGQVENEVSRADFGGRTVLTNTGKQKLNLNLSLVKQRLEDLEQILSENCKQGTLVCNMKACSATEIDNFLSKVGQHVNVPTDVWGRLKNQCFALILGGVSWDETMGIIAQMLAMSVDSTASFDEDTSRIRQGGNSLLEVNFRDKVGELRESVRGRFRPGAGDPESLEHPGWSLDLRSTFDGVIGNLRSSFDTSAKFPRVDNDNYWGETPMANFDATAAGNSQHFMGTNSDKAVPDIWASVNTNIDTNVRQHTPLRFIVSGRSLSISAVCRQCLLMFVLVVTIVSVIFMLSPRVDPASARGTDDKREGAASTNDASECHNTPCVNGATCLESNVDARVSEGAFLCECAIGFGGPTCADDGRRCHPENPCKNEGSCEDKPGGEFSCFCKSNWDGETCEVCLSGTDTSACVDVDECASKPCQNGGLCRESSTDNSVSKGAYICSCEETLKGFTGDNCESSKCPNHASEVINEQYPGLACVCDRGYTSQNTILMDKYSKCSACERGSYKSKMGDDSCTQCPKDRPDSEVASVCSTKCKLLPEPEPEPKPEPEPELEPELEPEPELESSGSAPQLPEPEPDDTMHVTAGLGGLDTVVAGRDQVKRWRTIVWVGGSLVGGSCCFAIVWTIRVSERSGKARQHTRMLELQPDALRISKMLDSDARAALSSMDLTEPVLPPPLPSKWDSWRVWTAAFWSD